MRFLASVILLGIAVNLAEAESCYNDVRLYGLHGGTISNCTSIYSELATIQKDLHRFAATHLEQNFKYLLMSVYFNNYEANRGGLSMLYRKLADDAWEDTIDLIKYMAKRGFNMDYGIAPRRKVEIPSYKMSELHSLATALDMQKTLAEEAHNIHREATVRNKEYHDAETINFLKTEFVPKHAATIRELAGHTNDLHQLIKDNEDPSLGVYLFDEHLKKALKDCSFVFLNFMFSCK